MRKSAPVLLGVLIMSISAWKFASTGDGESRYHNSEIDYQTSWKKIWQMTKAFAQAERKAPTPKSPIPVHGLSADELAQAGSGPRLYRLGHSTVLIRLDQQWILTDPVFSERASPVQWAGPKRFHAPPIHPRDLPAIDVVVISHNHYDHLDQGSIQLLRHKVRWFLVPLGVGQHLMDWGVPAAQIMELGWWESRQVDELTLTATPAQHFSGRRLMDRNRTLWASWVIQGVHHRIFFSGDSGYFGGFKTIGERFGPFDATLIETGAYNPLWKAIHMLPEESVQAHLDLQGRLMVSIHNSTFDLALHDWNEPMERALSASRKLGVQIALPMIGEPLNPLVPATPLAWWREGDSLSERSSAESFSAELHP